MASVKTRKGNVSEDLKVLRYLTPVFADSLNNIKHSSFNLFGYDILLGTKLVNTFYNGCIFYINE